MSIILTFIAFKFKYSCSVIYTFELISVLLGLNNTFSPLSPSQLGSLLLSCWGVVSTTALILLFVFLFNLVSFMRVNWSGTGLQMCSDSAQVSLRSHKSCVFEVTLRGIWKLLLVLTGQSFWKQLYNHKKQRKPESKVEQVSVQAPVHRTIAFCAYVWVFKWVTEKHLVCVLGNKKNKKSFLS